MKSTNSTRLLRDIIEQIYQIEEYHPILSVWASILKIRDEQDVIEINSKFTFLLDLIDEVRDEISNLNKFDIAQTDVDDYLSIINDINVLFHKCNPFSGYGLNELQSKIDRTLIRTLSLCSDLIKSNFQGFNELSFDELEEFQKDISELISEIYKSEIDEQLKAFLIEKLKELELLIINYRTQGKIKIKKVSSQVIGDIIFFVQRKNLSFSVLGDNFLKFIEIASKLNGSVGLFEKIPNPLPLIESIVKHLPPGN